MISHNTNSKFKLKNMFEWNNPIIMLKIVYIFLDTQYFYTYLGFVNHSLTGDATKYLHNLCFFSLSLQKFNSFPSYCVSIDVYVLVIIYLSFKSLKINQISFFLYINENVYLGCS